MTRENRLEALVREMLDQINADDECQVFPDEAFDWAARAEETLASGGHVT